MRELKLVDWPKDRNPWLEPSNVWLVAVNPKDGSYFPVFQIGETTHDKHTPTLANQLFHAATLALEKGIDALDNPHGMIGRTCKCGTCFCCAAAAIVYKIREFQFAEEKAGKQ